MFRMDYKRAILAAVIVYALIFLGVSGIMFVPGMFEQATMEWSLSGQLLMLVIAFAVVYFTAKKFYFKKKPKDPLNEGVVLGLIIAAISFLIEIPLMVYGFAAQTGWAWYAQWNILAGYAITIIAAVIAAMSKKK